MALVEFVKRKHDVLDHKELVLNVFLRIQSTFDSLTFDKIEAVLISRNLLFKAVLGVPRGLRHF